MYNLYNTYMCTHRCIHVQFSFKTQACSDNNEYAPQIWKSRLQRIPTNTAIFRPSSKKFARLTSPALCPSQKYSGESPLRDPLPHPSLFCKRDCQPIKILSTGLLEGYFAKEPYKRDLYSAKETYILKEPTNHSHPSKSPMNRIFSTPVRDCLTRCDFASR